MGDRANVYIHEGARPGVYLYTHWDGYRLPNVVQDALRRGESRWNDDQYLARIVFCEMVGDQTKGESGYGISAAVGDGDDRIVDLDTSTQTVKLTRHGVNDSQPLSFTEYVQQEAASWPEEEE